MNMKDVRSIGERLASGKAKSQGWIDASVIRELAVLLNETGLSEVEIEQNGARVRVARQVAASFVAAPTPAPASAAPAEASAPAAAGPQAPPVGAVTSPMVGTVYTAPEPGKPPFVKVGDTVKEGDTILIVEAMKTMNPIAAPRSGTVKDVCVRDSEPVEFGQTLIVIG
jgi:acetyl-CoA carboxylase biotin carboxyl carrier protein